MLEGYLLLGPGEYLVAAELSRRGLIATTFTGNVPHYDIIASDAVGRNVLVQVKASRSASWQFGDVSQYCEVSFRGDRQIVGRAMPCPVRNLVMVFAQIDEGGADEFYVLKWVALRNLLKKKHVAYLEGHGGVRPRNPRSLHVGIKVSDLRRYRDKWETLEGSLR